LKQQHAALLALCELEKEPPEIPVKCTPESFGVGIFKIYKHIYDALAHFLFSLQTKRAKALPIDDHRREAYWARSKDSFSTSTLQGIGLTNAEFHELTAVMFGLPSPICKQHFGAQIKKANQNKTVDLYGDTVKTATGVSVGSFMHVHQAMVNMVGNDLRNAHIMFKTGIDAFSGAVSGNMESKKRSTQNILLDMIIRAQDGVTSNIMIDLKSLYSTSTAYQHGEGKFGGGVEVRQE
jgi:hypothetical protein